MADVNDRDTIPDDTPTSPETPSARGRRIAVARRATVGTWLDTSVPLTRAQALEFAARGFRGRFGYVPLPGNDPSRDVSRDELAMLLDVGLEVGLVQHPRRNTLNVLRLHSGGADAMAAAQWAASIGFPGGAHLFLDLEGVLDTTPGQVTTYCVDWARACMQLGYSAGLYVGYSTVLGPQELYELPLFDCYWTDAVGRKVNVRGCAVRQRAQVPAAGGLPNYDPDEVKPDALGGLPLVAAAAYLALATAVVPPV